MTSFESEDVKKLVTMIVDDKNFTSRIEEYIKNMMKDGQIDYQDVPEIIMMIMDIYGTIKESQLITADELPEFIKTLFNIIVKKYNLIADDKRQAMDPLITGAIKLVLLIPRIKKSCCSCF
jgi:hypothetical protein